MIEINTIKAPFLNSNEDDIKIVEILKSDFNYVKKNEHIISLESSKVIEEIHSDYEGYIK